MRTTPMQKRAPKFDPEAFEKGNVVEVGYRTDDGDVVAFRGTVCKSNSGGIVILKDKPEGRNTYERRPLRTVHPRTGTVFRNNREGNGSQYVRKALGDVSHIGKTGETRDVSYKHHTGWKAE